MAAPENSKDKLKLKIAEEELNKFNKLIDGHRRLLTAIGCL